MPLATLAHTVPIAFIAFDFDPLLRLTDAIAVRWQTVALAVVIGVGLLLTGLIARRHGLRLDDLLFIAVAAVPGAVIGGRLGYVLLHIDYYGTHTAAILDPGQGSLELALAVVGGALSAAYVAGLLGAPIGTWLRSAALPLLLVLGAGKLAMALGGVGQGQPADLAWATAYVGAGPWGSLAPAVPAHPSQLYEGVAALAILLFVVVALAVDAVEARGARLFVLAFGAWAVARAACAITWRDLPVAFGLNAGGLIAIGCAIGAAAIYLALGRRGPGTPGARLAREVDWADPETRPRF